jgi:Uma2 family endonuclease
MVSASRHAQYSIQEYVRLEEYSNVKHEFLGGQIYAMAGGTPEHGAMAMRIGALLFAQLTDRPCVVYNSDVRIRVVNTGLDTYPDLSVVCGHEERDLEDRLALVNPIVLVEVLSPSTEEYDRGEKLDNYRSIASLQEVVLVSHDRPRVEVWRREGSAWNLHAAHSGESIDLVSIRCSLSVDAIFRNPLGEA